MSSTLKKLERVHRRRVRVRVAGHAGGDQARRRGRGRRPDPGGPARAWRRRPSPPSSGTTKMKSRVAARRLGGGHRLAARWISGVAVGRAVGDDERDVERRSRPAEVGDEVLDRHVDGVLDALDEVAPQPARASASGSVEMMIRSGWYSATASIVGGVRVGVADLADASMPMLAQHAAARGRRAPGRRRRPSRRRSRLPCGGFLRGTQRTIRTGPLAASSRARSSSLGPASVSLATTRMVRIAATPPSGAAVRAAGGGLGARWHGRRHLRARRTPRGPRRGRRTRTGRRRPTAPRRS